MVMVAVPAPLMRAMFRAPVNRDQRVGETFCDPNGVAVGQKDDVVANVLDRGVDQIANDRLDVATHVAHLGELRCLDLDERGIGEPREAAGDLGLAHPGGADHENILRGDFAAQRFVDLLAAPAVAQGDGDGALGFLLADNVLVQFLDDFAGCHVAHGE